MSKDKNPRLGDLMELTEEQEADIEINGVRSKEQVTALESVLQVVRGINGIDDIRPLIDLLNLPVQTENNMITREEWLRTLQNGAGDAWQATRNFLKEDENGKPALTFPGLELLLEELLPPRSSFLTNYSRLRGKRILTPTGIVRNLGIAQPVSALPDTHVPPFIPDREKDVYRAITIAGYTESGREAIRSTLSAARRKVGIIAQENLFRATTYNEIVLKSVLSLFEAASSTRNEAVALFQELERMGESDEFVKEALKSFDPNLNEREMMELGGNVLQNIEFVLKMANEEKRVDQVMERLIPGYRLVKLKKRIEAVLPPQEKEKVIVVINSALQARQNAAHMPPTELPDELEARLHGIRIAEIDED